MTVFNEEIMHERYTDSERLHTSSSIMNARKIKLFYHPVLKGAREPTQEEIQQKVTTYLTRCPELKPRKTENCSCFKISPSFTHSSVECYLIVSPKLLKGTRRFEGYNKFFQQGLI